VGRKKGRSSAGENLLNPIHREFHLPGLKEDGTVGQGENEPFLPVRKLTRKRGRNWLKRWRYVLGKKKGVGLGKEAQAGSGEGDAQKRFQGKGAKKLTSKGGLEWKRGGPASDW